MATFTSKATGNWDTEGVTTWNEAGHPIAGDTVTIQNGHTITLDSATSCATLTIDSGGVLTDATNNVGLTVSGATSITGTLTCGSGAMSFGSGVATAGYSIIVNNNGTFTGGSGTHTVGSFGGGTGGSVTLTSDTMTLNGENTSAGGVYIMSNAMGSFDNGNGTIICTYTGDDTKIDSGGETLYNLTINAVGTKYDFTDTTIIANNLTITAGELNMDNADLTITGNLSNAGTFTPNTGLVTLNGTNQTLTGSWTFWSFTKSVGAADTLTFDNTATYTFGGNITLNGASGQLLSLISDSAGDAFDFIMSSGAVKTNLSYLSVKDSDASGSDATLIPIMPTNSTNVSGNTYWFDSPVTGGNRNIINNYYYG